VKDTAPSDSSSCENPKSAAEPAENAVTPPPPPPPLTATKEANGANPTLIDAQVPPVSQEPPQPLAMVTANRSSSDENHQHQSSHAKEANHFFGSSLSCIHPFLF